MPRKSFHGTLTGCSRGSAKAASRFELETHLRSWSFGLHVRLKRALSGSPALWVCEFELTAGSGHRPRFFDKCRPLPGWRVNSTMPLGRLQIAHPQSIYPE